MPVARIVAMILLKTKRKQAVKGDNAWRIGYGHTMYWFINGFTRAGILTLQQLPMRYAGHLLFFSEQYGRCQTPFENIC